MSEYILIVWLVMGNGAGIASAEFKTKEACDSALAATIEARNGFMVTVSGLCVPK